MFANDSVFQLQAGDWSLKARNEAKHKPENTEIMDNKKTFIIHAEINQIFSVKHFF